MRLALTRGCLNDKGMVPKSVSDVHAAPEGLNKNKSPIVDRVRVFALRLISPRDAYRGAGTSKTGHLYALGAIGARWVFISGDVGYDPAWGGVICGW